MPARAHDRGLIAAWGELTWNQYVPPGLIFVHPPAASRQMPDEPSRRTAAKWKFRAPSIQNTTPAPIRESLVASGNQNDMQIRESITDVLPIQVAKPFLWTR